MNQHPVLLLAEDDSDAAHLFRRTFEKACPHWKLVWVVNGLEAINHLLKNGPPRIVITDLHMPAVSGFELITWIREKDHQPRIPITVMSTLIEPDVRKKCRELPGRAFLSTLLPKSAETGRAENSMPANELHFKLLGQFGPPSLVVDAQHEIVHLSENANRFLQLPEGEPTRNLLRLVHPMLRVDLRAALLRAAETGAPVEVSSRIVNLPGGPRSVDLHISPAGELAPGFLLVIFAADEPAEPEALATQTPNAALEPAGVVLQLEREITRANSSLRDTVEQYEASTEELKASNEELQAMNEELRSAGEELETGREELQSVNEELTTVNVEFKGRVEELARTNSDLRNLMNATQIATIFLDREMGLMRYTPSAVPLFDLIPGDIGRPITHLKTGLDYPDLAADAAEVLRGLLPVERELRAAQSCFLARVLPYRTVEDHIAGVVLTFVDVTARRSAEEAVRAGEAWLAGQNEAFQLAINGAPLEASLNALVRIAVERAGPGARCAFYIADPTGTTLHHVVGMSKAYADCIDSFRISRDSLACGLAVYLGQPVITPDVDTDPKWKDWREIAHRYGYRGVHSFPIETKDGKIVGTFNMYFEQPREATPSDLLSATVLTQAGAIIISQKQEGEERAQIQNALRESEANLRVAAQESERARKEAEAAGEAKDNFLAVLSHELRTPLTPVAMVAQSLSRRKDLPKPLRESLEMIWRNVQLEARLVDDLLDITKIERGKMELVRQPVELHEVIRRAVETTKLDVEAKKQQLTVQLKASQQSLEGDASRLQQVVWNLLKNASKFTSEDGEISLHTWNEPGKFFIEVRDTGIGIEAESLPKVFEAFSQANVSITRRFGGLGLGLAIARAIVAAHEGEIHAASEGPGHGAVFTVVLPITQAQV